MCIQSNFVFKKAQKSMFFALFIFLLKKLRILPLFCIPLYSVEFHVLQIGCPRNSIIYTARPQI